MLQRKTLGGFHNLYENFYVALYGWPDGVSSGIPLNKTVFRGISSKKKRKNTLRYTGIIHYTGKNGKRFYHTVAKPSWPKP